jgi:hypothetical protein
MRSIAVLIALACCMGQAYAAKSCDELKAEVAAKLDGKSVKGYTLEVVASDKTGEGKVVGSCNHGANKLVYRK